MNSIVNWIIKELKLETVINVSTIKLNFLLLPLFILLQLISFALVPLTPMKYRIWNILVPMIILAIVAFYYRFQERNNPNRYGYYLFHYKKWQIIVLILGAGILLLTTWYAQCNSHAKPFNVQCINDIFSGKLDRESTNYFNDNNYINQ